MALSFLPRSVAALLALTFVSAALVPVAPAASTWEHTYVSEYKPASQYDAWGGHPTKGPAPAYVVCDTPYGWNYCWDMGYGWVRWRFDLWGPDGKGFDWLHILVDDDQWFAGGHCIYTLEPVSGWGEYKSEGKQCHYTNGRRAEIVLSWYDSFQPGSYYFTVWCEWTCDHLIHGVKAWAGYDALTATIHGYTTTHEVSPPRAESLVPQSCVTFSATGSAQHSTVVRVDWGDGNVETVATSVPYHETRCHTYLVSTIPYQVCIKSEETDGLRRSITECRDVWGGVQP